jgi:hypothetical protein
VPFGPAGRARAHAAKESDSVGTLPPGAHDFWGEDSAALHDAMQAPPSDPPAPVRRDRWSVGRVDPSRWFSSSRHGRARRWLAFGVPGTALTAIAIAVIATGAPSVSGRHGVTFAARQLAQVNGTALTTAERSAAARSARLATARRSTPRRTPALTGPRRPRTAVHRSRRTTHNSGVRHGPSQPIQYVTPTDTAVLNRAPVQSASSEPAETSDTAQNNAPSGPVGQGAPFGPGRVG